MRKIFFLFIALVCATMTAWAVDWSTVEWLPNSNEKYKLFISPNFGDQYGGKRVENGTNLWIGFPSAAFGNMSIAPNGGDGAWRTFALSNFPNKENEFTVKCEGTTYTFTVYYNVKYNTVCNNQRNQDTKYIKNSQLYSKFKIVHVIAIFPAE